MRYILIADIGGTNARYALVDEQGNIVKEFAYKVSPNMTLEQSAALYVYDHAQVQVAHAIIAAAGPQTILEDHSCITLSNSSWICDQKLVAQALDLQTSSVSIINDMGPYCYAIPTLDQVADVQKLNTATARTDSTSVAVVPGTGLGTGSLSSMGKQEIFVPSEMQHTPAPASTPHQRAIVDFLATRNPGKGPVTTEDLCSFGRGLNNLYVANLGLAGETNSENEITGTAIVARSTEDPICSQTLDDFCALLGAFSAQFALASISRGGAYLFGAHEKLGPNFRAEQFMGGVAACLQGKPAPVVETVESIPFYLVTAQTPAFRGLQRAAQQLRLP